MSVNLNSTSAQNVDQDNSSTLYVTLASGSNEVENIIGGSGYSSGVIHCSGDIARLTVLGDVKGGGGDFSGRVESDGDGTMCFPVDHAPPRTL